LREKLTFANVMSTIAVFLALGGSALAIKANSVGSRQIKDDSIKGRDVADAKLKGKDLKAGTIGSREIDEAAFDLDSLVRANSQSANCDPNSVAFVSCGHVALGSLKANKALLVAGGGQSGSGASAGTCKFRVNGADVPGSDAATTFGDTEVRDDLRQNGIALTAVISLLGSGSNDYTLVCNELSGDVSFSTTFSVLAIAGTGN
jgi:hypothetical protein